MQYEQLVQFITTGAERWKQLRDQQYKLKLPSGVYSSELTNCALLSGFDMDEGTLGEQVIKGAEMLVRLKQDERVRKHLTMSTDVPAIFALAALAGLEPEVRETQTVRLSELSSESDVEVVATPQAVDDIKETERQLEPCPECGFGSPDYQRSEEPAVSFEEETESPEGSTITVFDETANVEAESPEVSVELESPAFEPACAHVGKDGCCTRCTGEPTTDCSGCEESIVVASCERCADHVDDGCESIFCVDCAKDSLNERGFCEDCELLECDSCGEDFDNGTEKQCKGENCDDSICTGCADDVLNIAGFCSDCSGEQEITCDGCDEEFIESRTTPCKGPDCEIDYCARCKEARLDAHEHCADCARERRRSLQ